MEKDKMNSTRSIARRVFEQNKWYRRPPTSPLASNELSAASFRSTLLHALMIFCDFCTLVMVSIIPYNIYDKYICPCKNHTYFHDHKYIRNNFYIY